MSNGVADEVWNELRRLDRQHNALINDHTRMQGEADEVCSRVERLEKDMANVATKPQLQHTQDLINEKLAALKESIDPLRRGIYALVWLIIAAVVGGGLAFLIRTPPRIGP